MVLLLAGCTAEEPAVQEPRPPVVVYASYADKAYLPARLAGFTEETGIAVIVRHASHEAIVDDLIADEINPPADVILTRSIRGVTRAADEGALRPLPPDAVPASIPAAMRDRDGFWVALAYRVPVVVFDGRIEDLPVPATWDELAAGHFRGRLCLASAERLVNRTVIASLINARGSRPTELLVRGWVANLATTPLERETDVIRAIEDGRCAIGVTSSTAFFDATNSNADSGSQAIAIAGGGIDVETAGIGRHARNPAGAALLVAWLLGDEFQNRHSQDTLQSPASETVPDRFAARVRFERTSIDGASAQVAWADEDAIRLAERARFP